MGGAAHLKSWERMLDTDFELLNMNDVESVEFPLLAFVRPALPILAVLSSHVHTHVLYPDISTSS